MSNRLWASALFLCVVAAIVAVLPTTRTDRVGACVPGGGATEPPRLVVRETAVPESERTPKGPVRVHTIEYVRGTTSTVVVKDELYSDEVDPALRASGRKELELFDSLLS